jgi:hypothetical protein
MATKDLTEWWAEVAPDIAGVPMPAVQNAVRNATIEFCKVTLLWTYTLTRITVAANTQSYTLTIPEAQYGEIISTDDVKYKQDGLDDDQFVTLDPISENQEDLHSSGSWKFTTSTTPSGYWLDKDKTLYLYRTPTVASTSGLLVTVNLRPTRSTTVVQAFIYNDHYETIGNGAKADLFARKAMPWYDPNLAMAHRTLFQNAINDAKFTKVTGYTKRQSRARMQNFA